MGNFKNESVLTNGSVFKNKPSFCFSHLETAFTTVPHSLGMHVKLFGTERTKILQYINSSFNVLSTNRCLGE